MSEVSDILCSKCHSYRSRENFWKSEKKRGFQYQCKDCHRENRKKYIDRERKYADEYSRKILYEKFNFTEEEYNKMNNFQHGKCLICYGENGGKRLSVDHCHKTGRVRGLLCNSCNIGLGNFRDSIDFLKNAVDYLSRYK